MKKILIVVLLAVAAIVSLLIVVVKRNNTPELKRPVVVASSYPAYFLAKEIMGERGTVYNITPPGAEPHDYDLSTGDRIKIEKSDIILLNGGKLEPWGENIAELYKDRTVLKLAEPHIFEGDPHVWLDPVYFARQAESIYAALAKADPEGQKIYEKNAEFLVGQLDLMDRDFASGLGNCEKNSIVVTHEAFRYLGRRYGFSEVSVTGVSPDSDPSPQAVAEVADYVKRNGVKHIFFESLVSPKITETIARETGADVLVLDPLEGLTPEQEAANKNYFTEMRNNLKNLRTALVCR